MKQTAIEWYCNEMESLRVNAEINNMDAYKFIIRRAEIFEQAKEMEKQQNYSIDFIMWYSGMDKEKIENAHKRWINETFK
jgi:hypothetical protein